MVAIDMAVSWDKTRPRLAAHQAARVLAVLLGEPVAAVPGEQRSDGDRGALLAVPEPASALRRLEIVSDGATPASRRYHCCRTCPKTWGAVRSGERTTPLRMTLPLAGRLHSTRSTFSASVIFAWQSGR